jgi:hypothetical protein
MNQSEKQFLKARITALEKEISNQRRLPKAERNETRIVDAQERVKRLHRWIRGEREPEVMAPASPPLTKDEFKLGFDKVTGNNDDSAVILEVKTKQDVDELWPRIKLKNVRLKIDQDNKELMAYVREKVKQDAASAYKFMRH